MGLPVVLLFSENGDSISLKIREESFRDVTPRDNIDPYLRNATECKTHQAVLEFLEGLSGRENFEIYRSRTIEYGHVDQRQFKISEQVADLYPLIEMIYYLKSKTMMSKY